MLRFRVRPSVMRCFTVSVSPFSDLALRSETDCLIPLPPPFARNTYACRGLISCGSGSGRGRTAVAVAQFALRRERTSVSMATFAFVTSGAVAPSPSAHALLSARRGRRVTFARRRAAMPTMCVSMGAAQSSEEEVLDEKAMRAAEIHEVLSGLEEFKSRIVEDATRLAKKVRAPKKQLESALAEHPDIVKIDGHIAELQEELKQLGDR